MIVLIFQKNVIKTIFAKDQQEADGIKLDHEIDGWELLQETDKEILTSWYKKAGAKC